MTPTRIRRFISSSLSPGRAHYKTTHPRGVVATRTSRETAQIAHRLLALTQDSKDKSANHATFAR
jgi:hypothetical protein